MPDAVNRLALDPDTSEEPPSHVSIVASLRAARRAAHVVTEVIAEAVGEVDAPTDVARDPDPPVLAATELPMTTTCSTVAEVEDVHLEEVDDVDTVRTAYVIDTCVLLADPACIYRFDEHDVIVPLVVVEELERHKGRIDEVGVNARHAVRLLEELRIANGGSLVEAAALPGEGRLRVESNHLDVELPPYLDASRADHRILATAIGCGGVLVTKDAALRLKAAQLGARTQDYRGDTAHVGQRYEGVSEIDLEPALLDELHSAGSVAIPADEDLRTNECAVIRGGGLARVSAARPGRLVRVNGRGAFGVQPRDARQTLALDLLLDPDVPCVSLMGMAGTGKTFLALAAGLEQVVEAGRFRRVSVYRPLVAVGRQEVGYLPGALDEKLAPWMAAVHDNLYALYRRDADGGYNDHRNAQRAVTGLLDRGQLEMAAITYLRGRSITDEYIIVDEAQNLEVSTLKVILTRMGEGSKLVFCGDLGQIDNPYISPHGGMAAMIEKLKGTPLFGHVTLSKGQRSPLAELAATSL